MSDHKKNLGGGASTAPFYFHEIFRIFDFAKFYTANNQ